MIEAVLVAPHAIGRITSAGASVVVEDVVLDVLEDAGTVTLERVLRADGGGFRCAVDGVEGEGLRESAQQIHARLTDDLKEYPELAGWSVWTEVIEEDAEDDGAVEVAGSLLEGDMSESGEQQLPLADESACQGDLSAAVSR